MTLFYFATRDRDGLVLPDRSFDFPSLEMALNEVRKVLAEMALDGIPRNAFERRSDSGDVASTSRQFR